MAKPKLTKKLYYGSTKVMMNSRLWNIFGKQKVVLERNALRNTNGLFSWFPTLLLLIKINGQVYLCQPWTEKVTLIKCTYINTFSSIISAYKERGKTKNVQEPVGNQPVFQLAVLFNLLRINEGNLWMFLKSPGWFIEGESIQKFWFLFFSPPPITIKILLVENT